MPAVNHSGARGGSAPSPRMILAQEFADALGDGKIERVHHHPRGGKRFYRVILRPNVVVDVHYPTWIVVNGTVFRNANEARLAAWDAIKSVKAQ